jgi:hypothetical protein
MKDKEFLEFLTQKETVPAALAELTRRDIVLSFHGKSILWRFIGFQVLGALISLSFCPQFGLSFFVEGHGITHSLRMIGDWACALFCGSLFLSMGLMIAMLFMKADELWWILRRKKIALTFLPALFWGVLMLLNVGLKLPSEAPNYHLVWLVAAILVQFLWLKGRSLFFRVVKA